MMKTKPTLSNDFTVEDIHKVREWHYEQRKEVGIVVWHCLVTVINYKENHE